MSSHLFQQLFTPELTIPNTTSTKVLISIIAASLSALIIGFLFVIISAIICITIYQYKSKVKSSVTSIELNGRLSNHYDTENNHNPTTTISNKHNGIDINPRVGVKVGSLVYDEINAYSRDYTRTWNHSYVQSSRYNADSINIPTDVGSEDKIDLSENPSHLWCGRHNNVVRDTDEPTYINLEGHHF